MSGSASGAATADGQRRILPLYALLAGNIVSSTGSHISGFAITWYVLERTGSPVTAGAVAAIGLVPRLLAAALGGTIVDRLGHRRASVMSDLVAAAAVAAIPLMDRTMGFNVVALLVLVFVKDLVTMPGAAARQSLTPELATLAGVALPRVNAAYGTVQRGTQLIGPLIAGTLVAAIGATAAIWVDAATFLVSAVVVGTLLPGFATASVLRTSYWNDVLAGFKFLRDEDVIRTVLVSIAFHNFLTAPILFVVLPVYGVQVLRSPIALGVLLAGFGAGAVAGGVLYAAYGQRLSQRVVFMASFALSGMPFGLLGLTSDPLASLLILFVIGVASGPINPLIATVIQQRAPAHFRARVFANANALAWITMPPGMVLAGVAVSELGIERTLQVVGIAFLGLVVIGSRIASLRGLDRPESGG